VRCAPLCAVTLCCEFLCVVVSAGSSLLVSERDFAGRETSTEAGQRALFRFDSSQIRYFCDSSPVVDVVLFRSFGNVEELPRLRCSGLLFSATKLARLSSLTPPKHRRQQHAEQETSKHISEGGRVKHRAIWHARARGWQRRAACALLSSLLSLAPLPSPQPTPHSLFALPSSFLLFHTLLTLACSCRLELQVFHRRSSTPFKSVSTSLSHETSSYPHPNLQVVRRMYR
jgi:hypothetical protein